jgi:ZIP family zinc transporter
MTTQAIRTAEAIWTRKPAAEKVFGTAIAILFVVQLIPAFHQSAALALADPVWREALLQSTLAGLATGIGALVLPLLRNANATRLGSFIAVAAGAMAMAAGVSLFAPALALAGGGGVVPVLVALAGGACLMALLDALVPHAHPRDGEDRAASGVGRVALLMVAAISLHNLPEGFAVGATATTGGSGATATAIALQNIPEGLIVAVALWGIGMRKAWAALAAVATGLLEPAGALIGIAWVGAAPGAVPLAMAAAAGAMAFVVAHEMIPTARRELSRARLGVYFTGGFATMTAASHFI